MRKKLTQTSKLLFLFIGLIFCISFSSKIKAQNCMFLNDGSCIIGIELANIGVLNGKNHYASDGGVYELFWNSNDTSSL